MAARRDADAKFIWDKWFWNDWSADPNLGLCSYAARGLWMELLALMAKSDRKGELLVSGEPPDAKALLRLTRGHSLRDLERAMGELKQHRVCSVTPDGIIFSRRMVNDARRRDRNVQNGRKGGNPELMAKSDNRETAKLDIPVRHESVNHTGLSPEAEAEVEARSRSQKEQDQHPPTPQRKKRAGRLDDPAFAQFWRAYPRKTAKDDAEKAWRRFDPVALRNGLLQRMLDALAWQVQQPGWAKDGGKFVPYPASWLNGRRWEDEPFEAVDPTDAAWDAMERRLAADRRPE